MRESADNDVPRDMSDRFVSWENVYDAEGCGESGGG